MKGTIWITADNDGAGSVIFKVFATEEEADNWQANNEASESFEGFGEDPISSYALEFDGEGLLLNPDSIEVDPETDIHKTMVKAPTLEEIFEEELELVNQKIDNDWRHGSNLYEVFYRKSDNTFWSVSYQTSGDGEYNSLRDGECELPQQVFPHDETKVVRTYTSKE